MRRGVLIVGLFFLISLFSVQPALACSGGDPQFHSLTESLERDVFVRGIVVQTDERGNNGILKVETYLKGSGSQYLMLSRVAPALTAVHHKRGYDTGCLYGGEGDQLFLGQRAYYGLNRLSTGAYHDGSSQYFVPPHEWGIADGNAIFWDFDPDEEPESPPEIQRLPIAEFEAMIVERLGTEPMPAFTGRLPRQRLLEIKTESGQRYRLPLDNGDPYPIENCDPICRVVSPDGSHYADLLEDGMIEFGYPYAFEYESYDTYGEPIVNYEGEAVLFSPTSDHVLVWDDDTLTIYGFYALRGSMYGAIMDVLPLTSIELNGENIPRHAAWSEDGTTIAYADGDGLWVFDFFNSGEPTQMVTWDDIDQAMLSILEVSSTGRFVRFGTMERWSLYDTETGNILPNILVSPDEKNLIRLDDMTQRPSIPGTEDDSIELPCTVPLMPNCAGFAGIQGEVEIRSIEWESNHEIIIWYCLPETTRCFIRQHDLRRPPSTRPVVNQDVVSDRGRQIIGLAYDPLDDVLALVVDDTTIRMGEFSNSLEIDLTDKLDSPIMDIEWGDSLWYTE